MEMNFASKGVAGAGLGLGIAGTALGVLSGGLGNLGLGIGTPRTACSEDHGVSRYEASQAARIAELETEVKLRDANIYTDSKIADVYERLSTRIGVVESQICNQAVVNAQITANIACMQNSIAALNGLTKTVIPIGNVCPEPMPAFNSWTAPTAPTTTG